MDLSLLACLVYVNGPWPVWYGCPLAYGPMAVVLSYGYGYGYGSSLWNFS
jgi:hypothetical protein